MGKALMTEKIIAYEENMSTMSFITKGRGKLKTKYMKEPQELVKEKLVRKDVVYNKTFHMIEDVLTKPMSGERVYNQLSSLFDSIKCVGSCTKTCGISEYLDT